MPAAIEERDIFQGGSMTVGRYQTRHRAVRRFFVTGLEATENTEETAQAKLEEAISTVEDAISDTHPTHPDATPVSHIVARKWTNTEAWVTVYYARRATGGGGFPDPGAAPLASYRTAFYSQRVYRGTKETDADGTEITAFKVDTDTGLPAGDLLGYSVDATVDGDDLHRQSNVKPDVEMWSRPVLSIQARTVETANVALGLAQFNSYINSANVTSGILGDYNIHTLRFDGVDVTEIQINDVLYEYPTIYKFTGMALGTWWGQRLKTVTVSAQDRTFLKYDTDTFQLYPATDFAALFPNLFTTGGSRVIATPPMGSRVEFPPAGTPVDPGFSKISDAPPNIPG
jgi:hypothetical protein